MYMCCTVLFTVLTFFINLMHFNFVSGNEPDSYRTHRNVTYIYSESFPLFKWFSNTFRKLT